jgi:GNAT superfamily N-acetyltransferase
MEVIFADLKHLDLVAPLFDAYRVFYKQQSDISLATSFLKERIQLKESIILLALNEEGSPMGFTQLYPMFSSVSAKRSYVLNDLYVAAAFRKKGVGETLLEAAKNICKVKAYKGIALETATDNPAQYLYERLGWKKNSDLQYFWSNTQS